MRIAIDLNDVIRDYSNNFVRYYIEGYNHEFNLSDFEFWSNNPRHVFEFSSDASYYNFVYNDYSFELYGKCPTCSKNTQVELNEFVEKTIPDLDENDDVELLLVNLFVIAGKAAAKPLRVQNGADVDSVFIGKGSKGFICGEGVC